MLCFAIQFSRCNWRFLSCDITLMPIRHPLGDVLLSQDPAVQVPSALKGLTVVFGMGTRGSPSPSSPNGCCLKEVALSKLTTSELSYPIFNEIGYILRKEVIQPHLPIRLPCYDFTPIIYPTFGGWLPCGLPHRLRVL